MNQPSRGGGASGGSQTLKAVVVIVVIVAVGWLVLDKSSTSTTRTAGSPTTKHSSHGSTSTTLSGIPTTTIPLIPSQSIKVQVLNGVGTGNLASEWSTKLKSRFGYDTLAPDNATTTVTASEIYVMTVGYGPEADLLASRIGLPASVVNPTIPAPATVPIKSSERAAPNLVLVVGPNLAGSA